MIKLKYNTITNMIPKGTSNLLEIISTDTDKKKIYKSTLDLTVAYILSRHEEKARILYKM